jgi:predicted amidohydrolase YtcJ
VSAAACRGLRVAVHCVTLGTLVAALEAFAAVPPRHRRGRGHRLEHLGQCPAALIPEIARLGLAVVSNPSFVHWRGDAYLAEDEVPPSWLYRLGSLARAGVVVAGASDAPVTPCDPWATLAAARTRRTRAGAVLAARERVGARAALGLVCRIAADVLGRPDLGRLEVGGVADVTVVDRDPVVASAEEVRETRVLLTMVGGEEPWRA